MVAPELVDLQVFDAQQVFDSPQAVDLQLRWNLLFSNMFLTQIINVVQNALEIPA